MGKVKMVKCFFSVNIMVFFTLKHLGFSSILEQR